MSMSNLLSQLRTSDPVIQRDDLWELCQAISLEVAGLQRELHDARRDLDRVDLERRQLQAELDHTRRMLARRGPDNDLGAALRARLEGA